MADSAAVNGNTTADALKSSKVGRFCLFFFLLHSFIF
jgi:hypothetical protein